MLIAPQTAAAAAAAWNDVWVRLGCVLVFFFFFSVFLLIMKYLLSQLVVLLVASLFLEVTSVVLVCLVFVVGCFLVCLPAASPGGHDLRLASCVQLQY